MAEKNTLEVRILDKEYNVACPPEARAKLESAAKYLDQKMREIRNSGKVFGTERIAVMAALNIAYELQQGSHLSEATHQLIIQMSQDLDSILAKVP
ncbi:MAG: cell division protein ZapA [Hahellaceae bacterium]|nr:cell division protein ZapA [Hahellaceae bacterium]MCP5168619.1 cell division protein ZapA [Hahellaceae bacterium]